METKIKCRVTPFFANPFFEPLTTRAYASGSLAELCALGFEAHFGAWRVISVDVLEGASLCIPIAKC
jgi:hypothetical protein